jgi:hypothetical protein
MEGKSFANLTSYEGCNEANAPCAPPGLKSIGVLSRERDLRFPDSKINADACSTAAASARLTTRHPPWTSGVWLPYHGG